MQWRDRDGLSRLFGGVCVDLDGSGYRIHACMNIHMVSGLEQGIIDLGSRLIWDEGSMVLAFLSHGRHMIGAEVW